MNSQIETDLTRYAAVDLNSPTQEDGFTLVASFGSIKHLLSDRPLHRPNRRSLENEAEPTEEEIRAINEARDEAGTPVSMEDLMREIED